jgi:hypothetical protein
VEEDKKMSGADFRLEGTFGGSKTSREHLEGEDCISAQETNLHHLAASRCRLLHDSLYDNFDKLSERFSEKEEERRELKAQILFHLLLTNHLTSKINICQAPEFLF